MLHQWIVVLIIFESFSSTKSSESHKSDPDEFRTPEDYIRSRGYIAETHHVVTVDGYILAIHRIIAPSFIDKPRKVVIVQHGLLLSSMVYIINSPGAGIKRKEIIDYGSNVRYFEYEYGNNLGFVLADYGYDVWLPNDRGNTYSTNHTKLNPFKDRKYWEFSFQEMAQKDLPAVIDYIRRETKQAELSYIGHSQGTLVPFILLSEKPEYSNILKPLIMLAPIVNVQTIKDQLRILIENDELAKELRSMGGPIFPHAALVELLPDVICSRKIHYICEEIVTVFGGLNPSQMNITRLPVYFSYVPAGASARNILHYHQAIKYGTKYFDYGEEGNKVAYGSPKSPSIQWQRINSSYIAIFYGENDLFSGPEELATTKRLFKTPFWFEFKVPDHLWSHMDFLWGKQAGEFVYSRILDLLKIFPIKYLN